MSYCTIAPDHPVHAPYHATEYGFPSRDDEVLFERLILEINQAGLSWLTILNKRAAFRTAYAEAPNHPELNAPDAADPKSPPAPRHDISGLWDGGFAAIAPTGQANVPPLTPEGQAIGQ